MNKIDTKVREVVYQASLREGFQHALKKLRGSLGIPADGFASAEESTLWEKSTIEESAAYYKRGQTGRLPVKLRILRVGISSLLTRFNLPASAYTSVENHLLNNDKFPPLFENNFAVALDVGHTDPTDIFAFATHEAHWLLRGGKYIRLLIHEGATKQDVRRFLDANWKKIQRALTAPDAPKAKRIRATMNKERDALIHELYGKSRTELGLKRSEQKDIAVARILVDKGYPFSPEIVRKVASVERKKRGKA